MGHLPLKSSFEFIRLGHSKNCYLLSRDPALTTLVHPELENEIRKCSSSPLPESNSKTFGDFGDIPYYSALYLFLKQHDFFQDFPVEPLQQFNFSPGDIQSFIASTENVTFEVTGRCNLACRYCGFGKLYDFQAAERGKDLQFQTAKNVIDFVWAQRENNGIDSPLFISFYGGEPFLNFDLINQIIGYVKNSDTIDDNCIKFRITTNGIELEKYADFLIVNDIFLTVSLDGDRNHNRYRTYANGKESFDSIYNQILMLKQKDPEYFKKHVEFNSILTDISNIKEIELFFQGNFGKTPRISELSLAGVKKESYGEFRRMYRTVAQAVRDSLDSQDKSKHIKRHPVCLRLFNLLMTHTNNFIFNSAVLQSNGKEKREKFNTRTGTCKPFQKKIFCAVDGNLLPCEKIPRSYTLAKVTGSSIEFDYKGICEQFRRWNSAISTMCMQCANGLNCLNCLFLIDFSDEKPLCKKFYTQSTIREKIHETLEWLEVNPNIYQMLFEKE